MGKRVKILICVLFLCLLAVADYEPPGLTAVWHHGTTRIHADFSVFKFQDGPVTCYLLNSADRGGDTGISCLVVK